MERGQRVTKERKRETVRKRREGGSKTEKEKGKREERDKMKKERKKGKTEKRRERWKRERMRGKERKKEKGEKRVIMGNSDSNFTCEGAELQPTNTWWGRGYRASGRSYRKPSQPIRSQSRSTKHQQNVDLNADFGTVFTSNVFEHKWTNPQRDFERNSVVLSVKNGSLSSEENLEKCEMNLSNGSCQDSGFGEVPSPVSSQSPGSSPDLVLVQDLKDLMSTDAEADAERKDAFRSRIRKWSDWTGSLRIKKRRVQDPDLGSTWSFNPFQNQDLSQIPVQTPDQTQRLSIYQNFKQDLESKSTLGSTKTSSDPDSADPGEQQGLGSKPGPNQDPGLDRGVVRRAGWVWIKPLIKLSKDQLELVPRRKWKKYWVKLRGCWLQFFKSPGLDQDPDLERDMDPVTELREGELGPVMELRVWDSLVQPVPEHPTKEHVFCLSNAVGQVYLLQSNLTFPTFLRVQSYAREPRSSLVVPPDDTRSWSGCGLYTFTHTWECPQYNTHTQTGWRLGDVCLDLLPCCGKRKHTDMKY
ncbi:hypothetical protein WMY93_015277 [Mugilogobius chulae]|uniref:Uncharacterized protein n=1 Tax=Mugilogobius chulae TaxID=88201 RepID=A0AAW0NQ40_9GOBI